MVEEVRQFAKDHLLFVSVVVLGVFVVLAPWDMEVLGFGEAIEISRYYRRM